MSHATHSRVGAAVRRKQKGASSKKTRTKKVVPLMNDDEEEQETYNGAPPLTKREKMARLSSQRITKVASGEKVCWLFAQAVVRVHFLCECPAHCSCWVVFCCHI